MQAITHNGKQLVLTVMLLTIVVYIYTVIAFNFFRKFYVSEEEEGAVDQKCHDMLTVRKITVVVPVVVLVNYHRLNPSKMPFSHEMHYKVPKYGAMISSVIKKNITYNQKCQLYVGLNDVKHTTFLLFFPNYSW